MAAMHMMNTTDMMMMDNSTMMHHHHHGPDGMMNTTGSPHDMHNMHGGHAMDTGAGADHSQHGAGAGHSMQMYFHTGLAEYILFESLHTGSVGSLIGACAAMFVLSVLYEGLKYFREYLLRRASLSNMYAPSTGDGVITKQPEVGARMLSGSHGIQTFLHMVQVFVSYCLMLVFMTYNVWLCLAIITGAGLGYFFFGWRRAMVVDMNEHCH